MGLFSRLLGIDNAIAQGVQKTIKESYSWLPGVPAPGTLGYNQFRPDADGFLPVGFYRNRTKRGDNPQAYLEDEGLRRIREDSRNLCVANEYARNGLTNRRNYIVGTGFKTTAESVDPDAPNDALIKQVNEWLQRYAVLTKRCEKEKESVFRGDRDGEVFIRLFKKNVLEWRFIEPEYVGNWDGDTPFGIKTDPKDITQATSYLVRYDEGEQYEEVPADEIIHVKLNTDSGIKRGLPFLYPVHSILRKIESTNENMATTVAIMASIAFIRRNSYATSSAIDSNNSTNADIQTTGPFNNSTDNFKTYRAGTILDTDANTEYDFPANKINLGGVVGCKESLLQTAAAGMGLPEYMLTSDASNGNFASTQVAETPAIAGFLAMQHYWADQFGSGMWVEGAEMGLTWKAIEYAVEQGQLPGQVLQEIQLKTEGPSIEVRDKTQETNRNKTLADDGIISRDTWAKKEGHAAAHKSDEEVKADKEAEMQATQSHELAMAGAKGKQQGLKESFDEDKHPRDDDGKFASGGSGGEGEKGREKEPGAMTYHEYITSVMPEIKQKEEKLRQSTKLIANEKARKKHWENGLLEIKRHYSAIHEKSKNDIARTAKGNLKPADIDNRVKHAAEIKQEPMWTAASAGEHVAKISSYSHASFEVIGSVATKGQSNHDLDIMAKPTEGHTTDKLINHMEAMGYEYQGQSVVSPEEAKKQKKTFSTEKWSELHHFTHGNKKVEIWSLIDAHS